MGGVRHTHQLGPDPQLLTTGQVAHQLGVNTSTVRRWCEQGVLEFIQLPAAGRKKNRAQLRIKQETVDAILKKGYHPQGEQ